MRNLCILVMLAFFAGCGSCDDNNGANNGTTNTATNGATNTTTNGATNVATNGSTNNATTNSGTNNTTTATNNGVTEIPADQIPRAMHDMLCEASWECPNRNTVDQILNVHGRYDSLQSCKDDAPEPRFVEGLALREIVAGIQEGRIQYDPMKMAECVGMLKAQICDPLLVNPINGDRPLPTACSEAMQGQIAETEQCVHGFDCQGGMQCEQSGSECWGTCQTPPPNCGTQTCTDDQYCDAAMTCQTRKAAGETCTDNEECEEGTTCNTSLSTPVCVENGSVAEGDGCSNTQACEAGTFCLVGACAPLRFGEEGGDCGEIPGGGFSACQPGLVCLASGISMGTCVQPIASGGSCDETYQCAGELACVANECATPLADGATCMSDQVCESTFCDPMTNECTTPEVCMLP